MKRILVVDADRPTRHMIALQLRSAGYTVESASDGRRALQRVRGHSFDLVLLDVWMPGMDGLELLARLREEPSRPRVVVMTADDTSETLLRAVRQHAYRFITKPVEPAQLLEIVRSVLAADRCARHPVDAGGRTCGMSFHPDALHPLTFRDGGLFRCTELGQIHDRTPSLAGRIVNCQCLIGNERRRKPSSMVCGRNWPRRSKTTSSNTTLVISCLIS